MPLVRIDLIEGTTPDYRRAVSEAVYETMITSLKVPEKDRFQIICEHAAANFVFDPSYLGITRSAGCVFVQITLNEGRSVEIKRQFYAQLAKALHERICLRPEDLFINLVEVPKENWSFGNGEAQYAPATS
jgi:4-oxalocrotonate tautomerase